MERWIRGYIYGRDGGFIPAGGPCVEDTAGGPWESGYQAGREAYRAGGFIDDSRAVYLEAVEASRAVAS